MIVKITKLGFRKDPYHPESRAHVFTGDSYTGKEWGEPTIGERYNAGPLSTSPVMSIYVHDETSGRDKLVLPKDFPNAEHIEFPELQKGDKLLGTMNSIYHVRPLENK